MITEVVIALALLALGVALHFALGRAARRIPRWLAQRRGDAVGPGVRHGRAFTLGALALRTGLWLALAFAISERFEPLMQARGWSWMLLAQALAAPIFAIGERSYSVVDLLALPALLIGLWLAVGVLVRVIRSQIFEAAGVESGLQETLAILLRYAFTFLGAIVLLQGFGVDVRSLAIAASVLGVGIGFGLQNIANNFVSGLLINFERPIRPGDYVNVGAFEGTVMRVGGRSTTIKTLDGVLILIPNSKFLETEVVNWNLGDPRSRVHVPVGVAYGTDVARLRRALLEVARAHPDVEPDPRPQVQMIRFGESSLDFELLVWTRDPRDKNRLESDLNFAIEESLRKHGIEVPFPQRDLHLRSPGLEQAARAWARHVAPELAETEAAPTPKLAADHLAHDAEPLPARDRSPDEWSDSEVAAALARLFAAGDVAIRDRRHLLKVHRNAFVGGEAVDWLVMNEALTRSEAVELGERWIAQGLVRHVLDEHGFRDGHFYYQVRGGVERTSA